MDSRIGRSNNASDTDLKRKQPEVDSDKTTPKGILKIYGEEGKHSSSSNKAGFHKQQKREKLDWKVLRPPKYNQKD